MTAMCDVAFLLLTFFILHLLQNQINFRILFMPIFTIFNYYQALPETDFSNLLVAEGKSSGFSCRVWKAHLKFAWKH
ncbi:hypothetical protein HK413_09990 [Mucilaginibacter sp. S1162]|uniref:Uncharacterized protein n=1 Tax=Mucilaginibacter humi TaxID=2732510 RepID=A0ABX1W5W2_9SPHI|nr:hypothetical protein [Mucilaginibacter humi]